MVDDKVGDLCGAPGTPEIAQELDDRNAEP
jgi:hypothetical protein